MVGGGEKQEDMVISPSKSPTQPQAKKSGPGSASKTEDRPVTRNYGVRPPAPVITKPDRQLDKRSLDQPSEPLQKAYAKIDERQKSLEQRLQKMSEDNKQTLKDVMAELATDLNDKLELQAEIIQRLERDYGQVLGDYTAVQERVKQLEERLESSQTCSMSAAEADRPERRLPSQAGPSGQWEQVLSRVSRLTDCKMQD